MRFVRRVCVCPLPSGHVYPPTTPYRVDRPGQTDRQTAQNRAENTNERGSHSMTDTPATEQPAPPNPVEHRQLPNLL
jgi:hypothetical protein